jgi:hypothetical protein
MSQPTSIKVHTHIGHPRALCGLAPKSGAHFRIVDFINFFTAPEENQCAVCLTRIKARGYDIAALRLQFRTPYEVHQQLAA